MTTRILITVAVALTTFLAGCKATNPLLDFSTILNDLQSSSMSQWNLGEMDFSNYDVSSPVEQLGKEDISKSKSVGAVLGGVIAAVYCNKKYGSMAAVACGIGGGWAGGQLGQLVGTGIAIRRYQYATEYEFLESEIKASETAIKTRQQQLDEADDVIKALEKEASNLAETSQRTEQEIIKAEKIQEDINAKIEEQKILEERYTGSIAYLDNAIETSEEKLKGTVEDKEKTQERLAKLKANRNNLNAKLVDSRRQTETMQGILTKIS